MAYEKISNAEVNTMISWGKVGQTIEGHYLGTKSCPNKTDPTKPYVLHMFDTGKEVVGTWDCAQLKRDLTQDLINLKCLVEYKGLGKKTKGNPPHTFEIQVDKSDSIKAPF